MARSTPGKLLQVSLLSFAILLLASCAGTLTGGGSNGGGGGGAEATVPPVPAGLAAAAGNAQVALSWNASAGATSYNVKRATSSGGPYTVIASPGVTSFMDASVTNGTPYFYVVSAVNSAGESANSSQVSATPAAPVVAPAAPTGLAATAGNAQVALSWNASTGATSYNVKRATTSGGPYTVIASPATTSSVEHNRDERYGLLLRSLGGK